MTLAAHPLPETAAPSRALMPMVAAGLVYALLLAAGDQMLRDPDTYWQITVGNWILDQRAVPRSDIYSWTMTGAPWISTQWFAQALFAASYRLMGWAGPVVLAAASAATAFGLMIRHVGRWLAPIPTLVMASAAFALTVPHLVARPHVLALPVMVAFVGGLIDALDRRVSPPLVLLPLMLLWANLHGGFVFGLALIGPIALGAIWSVPPALRLMVGVRWVIFALLALLAACVTPYGWESMLASRRILNLGQALALIGEWRPADFGRPGPLEAVVLGGFAFALWRGFRLSPIRVLLLAGLIYMALSHVRNAEVLALLSPMLLARPIAKQNGGDALPTPERAPRGLIACGTVLLAVTVAAVSAHRYAPDTRTSPVAAAQTVKDYGLTRVLNDYDFGGYLISAGVPTFIDGRTELFGEARMVEHDSFSGVKKPEDFFALIGDARVEATLLRTQSAATKLLDHLDGWRRIYADDLAVVHLRDPNARASAPRLRTSLN